MNQADAYRAAYSSKNMSDKTIHEAASRMAAKSNVIARIKELRAEIDSPKIMSATKRAEKLSDLAENYEDPNVVMKAIDLLNKMTGEYTQKVQANVTYEESLRELSGADEY
jgi:phage terminase small subunit